MLAQAKVMETSSCEAKSSTTFFNFVETDARTSIYLAYFPINTSRRKSLESRKRSRLFDDSLHCLAHGVIDGYGNEVS